MNQYTNPYQSFSPNAYSQSNPYSPYYGQQMAQPQQQAPVTPVQPTTSIIQVNGVDGAKAYQMSPNSSVALFDMTGDRFFVKAADAAGFSTIKTFSFNEDVEDTSKKTEINNDIFATLVPRSEFDESNKRIAELNENVESLKKLLDELTK